MTCQIRKATNGQFFVRVVASNGLTLAHSETYPAKVNAINCARLIAGGGTIEDWA
ncbi:YegP family protein [Nocardioides sp.]|uniref:YegP family protein n=1 Tax=Nocardioides sp. TaxID=35761 RepID=UPI003515F1CD